MKEIIRIHIAKIPYDVELAAKRELETYLKALETYSEDAEIIQDVEIRITEILADRGVKKGAIISEDDVKALRQQLGEPRDFLGEGDIAIGSEDAEKISDGTPRKLYRNPDSAVLGGVLSGIASFFKINPLWVRLIFIIIAFASFGAAILVYAVLWVAVPPAKTATDKLQMAGQPVTVNSIRELNENDAGKLTTTVNSSGRRIITVLVGIFSVFGALGAAGLTVVMVGAGAYGGQDYLFSSKDGSGIILAAFILAIISGLLLITLFILGAYASFAQKITKRVLISGCVVIVLGLATFGTAIGLVQYATFQRNHVIEANTHTSPVTLPAEIKNAKSLQVIGESVDVKYIVTNDQPSATFRMIGDKDKSPKVVVSLDKDTLTVRANQPASQNKECVSVWMCNDSRPTLEIHGPALSHLTATDATAVTYQAASQAELTINTDKNARLTFTSGQITNLHLTAAENAVITGSDATISHLDVTVRAGVELEFGTIETLSLNDQNSCPSHGEARIAVWKVSSGNVIMNGTPLPAKSTDLACTKFSIRNEEE